MTALAKAPTWISPEEYLAWETAQEERFEYFEGTLYAMAEVTPNRARIALDLGVTLRNQLRGQTSEVFMQTMKIKIPPTFGAGFFYPDVVVIGDPADQTRGIFEKPIAVFEVLSPASGQLTQQVKTPAYMHLPSLQFYGIVSQDRLSVIVRRRTATGWEMEEFTDPQAVLQIEAIGCELTLAEIYERVVWPAPSEAA